MINRYIFSNTNNQKNADKKGMRHHLAPEKLTTMKKINYFMLMKTFCFFCCGLIC